jgi:hypothetical protein
MGTDIYIGFSPALHLQCKLCILALAGAGKVTNVLLLQNCDHREARGEIIIV